MIIRGIVFDVYKTLLEVEPPPPDVDDRWELLWEDLLADPPRLPLETFHQATAEQIELEHTAARSRGIAFPEVHWPSVVRAVLPEVTRLEPAEFEDFLYRHAGLRHRVSLAGAAADLLRWLQERGIPLGLASNSQNYTLRELREALSTAGLDLSLFPDDLCFFSFQNGFSKPDPHVFRLISARFQGHGIKPEEILMIGDRLDNDIEPAKTAGWRTWHLSGRTSNAGGPWSQLAAWLPQYIPNGGSSTVPP